MIHPLLQQRIDAMTGGVASDWLEAEQVRTEIDAFTEDYNERFGLRCLMRNAPWVRASRSDWANWLALQAPGFGRFVGGGGKSGQ